MMMFGMEDMLLISDGETWMLYDWFAVILKFFLVFVFGVIVGMSCVLLYLRELNYVMVILGIVVVVFIVFIIFLCLIFDGEAFSVCSTIKVCDVIIVW